MALHDAIDKFIYGGGACDIAMLIAGTDAAGGGFAGFILDVAHDDGGAVAGQPSGNGKPNATGSTRDDGDTVLQAQLEQPALIGVDDDRGERHVARARQGKERGFDDVAVGGP